MNGTDSQISQQAELLALAQRLLELAQRRDPLTLFLREVAKLAARVTGARVVELAVLTGRTPTLLRYEAGAQGAESCHVVSGVGTGVVELQNCEAPSPTWEFLCQLGSDNPEDPGSGPSLLGSTGQICPLVAHRVVVGAIYIAHCGFDDRSDGRCEEHLLLGIAQCIAGALLGRRAGMALDERVKELECLYAVARIAERPNVRLPAILQEIADLLPSAWQYPAIAHARVSLNGDTFHSQGSWKDLAVQRSPILIEGEEAGAVEVVYGAPSPALAEGPFLAEERSLIDAIAKQISMIVQRQRAEAQRGHLQEQLHHADRLATIGQLTASVAHELNEPLASVLGFAELSLDHLTEPARARRHLDRIVQAAMHARDIIRRLTLFGRQAPPEMEATDLGQLVRDGLFFLFSRCTRRGVRVELELPEHLPKVRGNRGQIHQVLVNLVANALHAMPDGGTLTIRARASASDVILQVIDTGHGMSPEVQKRVFEPFFTTREATSGTGLGLAVVKGIVSSHDGAIEFGSSLGKGTVFTVTLPRDATAGEAGDRD